jgi:transposase
MEAVKRIDALFEIERDINGKPPPERQRVRSEHSRPLVAELKMWLQAQRAKLSVHSETAKAIRYTLNCWSGLVRFLDDGRLCMTNNAAERALRCVAVGRHNWTFVGSDEGGRRAAAVYTLVETCLCRPRHRQVYAARRTMPSTVVFPVIHTDRHVIGSA